MWRDREADAVRMPILDMLQELMVLLFEANAPLVQLLLLSIVLDSIFDWPFWPRNQYGKTILQVIVPGTDDSLLHANDTDNLTNV